MRTGKSEVSCAGRTGHKAVVRTDITNSSDPRQVCGVTTVSKQLTHIIGTTLPSQELLHIAFWRRLERDMNVW